MSAKAETIFRLTVFTSIFAWGLMLLPYTAEAAPYYSKRTVVVRPGKVVVKLPARHKTVRGGGRTYFYQGGVYYQKRPSGYLVVNAPVGVIIPVLPTGFTIVKTGGGVYYCHNGVYYRRVSSGYVVTEAPPATIVTSQPVAVAQPAKIVKGKALVTIHTLNVRSGPSTRHSVIDHVHQGDRLNIYGSSGEWLYVELPSGRFGWVMSQFTARTAPAAKG